MTASVAEDGVRDADECNSRCQKCHRCSFEMYRYTADYRENQSRCSYDECGSYRAPTEMRPHSSVMYRLYIVGPHDSGRLKTCDVLARNLTRAERARTCLRRSRRATYTKRDRRTSKVLRRKTCAFGNAREHTRADLFRIVKREDYIWPAAALQNTMRRAGLALHRPADSQERRQHSARFA